MLKTVFPKKMTTNGGKEIEHTDSFIAEMGLKNRDKQCFLTNAPIEKG